MAGITRAARVLAPDTAPDGMVAGSDGLIGLPLLPFAEVKLSYRAATAGDRLLLVPARPGASSGAIGMDWPLAGAGRIEVELHPLRDGSVASVAAASLLARAGGGALHGPVHRVPIGFGVSRPVRSLVLDRPLAIAGRPLAQVDVRLFDWAGRSELPPDADAGEDLTVTGRRGRQRGWPILKLGRDVLGACASIAWQPQPGQFSLVCPASAP